jgi:hypothetical protein
MLYHIEWEGEPPTLDQVCARFGLGNDDVDREFGVVATDPDENLYAIVVEESAVERLGGEEAKALEGPYANPRIEPFDLQEPGRD